MKKILFSLLALSVNFSLNAMHVSEASDASSPHRAHFIPYHDEFSLSYSPPRHSCSSKKTQIMYIDSNGNKHTTSKIFSISESLSKIKIKKGTDFALLLSSKNLPVLASHFSSGETSEDAKLKSLATAFGESIDQSDDSIAFIFKAMLSGPDELRFTIETLRKERETRIVTIDIEEA